MRRRILLYSCSALVIGLDLLWGGEWWLWHYLVNPSLLLVIAITMSEGLVGGLSIGVVAGVGSLFFSAVHGYGHLLAFILAALTGWIFSRRVVTSRSTISFLSIIVVSTIIYGIALCGIDILLTVLNHQRIHLPLWPLFIMTILQIIMHPFILSIWRRIAGRHQYATLTQTVHRTF